MSVTAVKTDIKKTDIGGSKTTQASKTAKKVKTTKTSKAKKEPREVKIVKLPKKPKERKGYFYEKEEAAIVSYINEVDVDKKNRLFNTVLYPALTKMIESIIRRYKLFVPDEDFTENFNDTISYLLTKINHFKPIIVGYDIIESEREINNNDFKLMTEEEIRPKLRNAGPDDPDYVIVYPDITKNGTVKHYKKVVHKYKAYSYCGTVCKNYLMYKSTQYHKKKLKNTSYDDMFEEINNNMKYSTVATDTIDMAQKLIKNIATEIEKMIAAPDENSLNENEIKVGCALISLLRNWEELLPSDGSNKLQKSSVLYFLREETMMTTKEVRTNMKKFKIIYKILKDIENT